MNNISTFIKSLSKKQKLVISLIIVFLIFLNISRYSLITVETSSAQINLKNTSNEIIKSFDLEKGGKKTFIAKKGSYIIQFSKGESLSEIEFNLNYLNLKKFKEDPAKQKQALNLGSNERTCSKELGPETVSYFSCSVSTSSIQTTVNGIDLKDNYLDVESSLFGVVSPYKNSLLQISEGGEGLLAFNTLSDSNPEETSFTISSDIDRFITKENVATDLSDPENPLVAFVNKNKLVVVDVEKKQIKKEVELNEILKFSDDTRIRVAIVKNKVFILSGKSPGISQLHGELLTKSSESKIIVVDIENPQKPKVVDVPKELETGVFSVGSNNDVVFSAFDTKKQTTNLYHMNLKYEIKKITETLGNSEIFCINKNNLYFVKDGGVFLRELNTKTSRLVYKVPEKDVANIACYSEGVYLSLPSNDSKIAHLKIIDKDQLNARPESILPIEDDPVFDIIMADIFKNKLNIKLLDSDQYNNRNIPEYSPNIEARNEQKNKVIKYLNENGIKTENYSLSIFY